MSLQGQFYCRYCRHTELQTLQDLEAHRRDGYCHLPQHIEGERLPFSRKSEYQYRAEAELSNSKAKSRVSIDSYGEKK